MTVASMVARGSVRPHLLWSLLALSVALNLCFIGGALWIRFHEPAAPISPGERLQRIASQLALDPQQKKEFDDYSRAVQTRMHLMHEAVEPLMGEAWSELAKPDADAAKVTQLFDDAAQKRYGFRRELTTKTLSFLATLSPEQRAKFVDLARQRPWEKRHRSGSPLTGVRLLTIAHQSELLIFRRLVSNLARGAFVSLLRTRERRATLRVVLAAAIAATLSVMACHPPGSIAPPVAGQMLIMSDLHFDPMADPRLVDALATAEPDRWRSILEGSGDYGLGRYGRDSNWMLVRSALRQMVETLPDPSVVLISGDFLAHDFRREFDAAAGDHSDPAYRVFVRKTMQFLGQQIRQVFPTTPILPALGNNDEECGDYQLQPGGPFLVDTLPIVRAFVGNAGRSTFDQDWVKYGNFSAKVGPVRVLSTNTNFFSTHYRNVCGSPGDADPGRATLAWLEAELAAAQQAQERVWMVYHIPPGIDGYATLRQGICPAKIIPMWDPAYAETVDKLLRRYADTIVAGFAGHTHMDDFRLIGGNGSRYAFVLITPAISPIFGQNPAFRTASFDPSGGILDQTTYYLTNLPEAGSAAVAPAWRAEYSFTEQWSLPRVDLVSLERLYAITGDIPMDRERWHTLFPVSSPAYWTPFSGGRLAQAVRAFRCASGSVAPADYRQCYCGG